MRTRSCTAQLTGYTVSRLAQLVYAQLGVLAALVARTLHRLFFGQLRAIELEVCVHACLPAILPAHCAPLIARSRPLPGPAPV